MPSPWKYFPKGTTVRQIRATSGNAVTGEGKISLIFNFEKHQRKPFSKPQSLAYQRKTYPHGDIYAYITTKLCEEPPGEGGFELEFKPQNLTKSPLAGAYIARAECRLGWQSLSQNQKSKLLLIRPVIGLRIDHQLNPPVGIYATSRPAWVSGTVARHRHCKQLGLGQPKPNQIVKHSQCLSRC